MRDPDRIARILNKFQDAWINSPDMRLGQLLIAITSMVSGNLDLDLFNLEDDVLEQYLDSWIENPDKYLNKNKTFYDSE
jgi:uncharacterized protein YihD (DUF1040 family)